MIKQACVALLMSLSIASSADAMLPDSGWYWNRAQSGMGYEIEIQNNVLFMSVFMYGDDGHPIWIVTGGPMSSDHTYSGDAIQTDNGWCLDCAYKTPTVVPYGPVTVNFTGPTTATVTIKGVSIDVERQQFGWDFNDVATPLLGEWALVSGETSFPLYTGERITLSSTAQLSVGKTAVGNRTGESGANDIAIGYRDPDSGYWAILLDSSTSYFRLYVMDFEAFDRLEGESFLYLKTSAPDVGVASIGHRIKSASAAAGGNAPGTDKRALVTAEAREAADNAMRSSVATRTKVRASPAVLAIARRMQAVLGARAN
jgi:hypothetical protein